eukprot:GHRR01002934.1.p1 GENE.GHRR01002934.1~~GHRR01002934.1.p1  ORF type:complete len:346 (+),score=83.38 GHRR01002934.1:487-1524(+)
MLTAKVDQLSGRLDQLAFRVNKLQQHLATETAAARISRWVSRHPPKSDFLRQIAEGNTGSVHEVSVAHTPGKRVAVKRVDWSTHEQRAEVAKRVATEISVLQALKHPLLPTLHQVYSTGNEICLEMTLCSKGTLWHERQELGGKLPVEQVRQYAAELVNVLSYLHDNGVVYVDLKPENVLIQDCGHVMLCDMDLAHTMGEIDMFAELDAVSGNAGSPIFWGTLEYVAPEVAVHGAGAYSPSSDWWGLGVLIYELLLGLAPWDGGEYGIILEQIKQGDVCWPPEGVLGPQAEDLLRGLLTVDPAQRLGAKGVHQIAQHPFFAAVDWDKLVPQVQRDQKLFAELKAR